MPTPAVDRNVWSTGSAVRQTWFNPTNPQTTTIANPQIGRDSEIRPASVNNRFNADGWREPSPFHHLGMNNTLTGGRLEYKEFGTRKVVTGDIFAFRGSWPRGRECSTNTENFAILRALNDLQKGRWELGVAMAELHKAVEMVDGRLYNIGMSIRRFRQRNPGAFKKARSLLLLGGLPRFRWCDIPRAWLEVMYGWNPLIRDVISAVNWASSLTDLHIVAKGSARSNFTVRDPVDPIGWGSLTQSYLRSEIEERSRVKLYYDLGNIYIQNAADLGLYNGLGVVWETTRWSFIADWASPLSSWIAGLTADLGLQYKSGTISNQVVGKPGGFDGPRSAPNAELVSFRPPRDIRTLDKSFRRKVFDTRPWAMPPVKNPLSTIHLLNGAALIGAELFGEPIPSRFS